MITDAELKLVAFNGRLLSDAEYLDIARELLQCRDADRWIPVTDAEIQIGKLYYVINGGRASSAVPAAYPGRIRWFHSGTVEFVAVTHIIDPETIPLPAPPQDEDAKA